MPTGDVAGGDARRTLERHYRHRVRSVVDAAAAAMEEVFGMRAEVL